MVMVNFCSYFRSHPGKLLLYRCPANMLLFQTMTSLKLTYSCATFESRIQDYASVFKDMQSLEKLSRFSLCASYLNFWPWFLLVLLVQKQHRPQGDLLIPSGSQSQMHYLDDLLKMKNDLSLKSSWTIKLHNSRNILWTLIYAKGVKFFTYVSQAAIGVG